MRSATLVILALTACAEKAPRPAPVATGKGSAVAEVPAATTPDARLIEIDASPIAKTDILEGAAATEAMNQAGAGAPTAGEWIIGPRGLGPFVLGTPFVGLEAPALALGCRPPLARQATWTCGAPAWLALQLADGRLRQINVLGRDARALTDDGVGVGSSSEDAILAHGEPRPAPGGGWVLAALPGVRFVTDGKPTADAPGPRVVRIEILGPEALAPED
jgi:hypothetical protein